MNDVHLQSEQAFFIYVRPLLSIFFMPLFLTLPKPRIVLALSSRDALHIIIMHITNIVASLATAAIVAHASPVEYNSASQRTPSCGAGQKAVCCTGTDLTSLTVTNCLTCKSSTDAYDVDGV